MKTLIFSLFVSLGLSSFAHGAGAILYETFEQDLKKDGVAILYSPSNVQALKSYIEKISSNYNSEEQKLSKKLLTKIRQSLDVKDENLLKSNYQKSIHVIYSILSAPLENRKISAVEIFGMLSKFKTSIDNESGNLNSRSLNAEATNIVDASNRYLRGDQISALSIKALSEQLIPLEHPMWFNYDKTGANYNSYSLIEKWSDGEIKKDKKCSADYSVVTAKKVLFFENLKDTSTSPKFDAKDSCGVKWKVKVGNEAQIEVVTNQLYLAAGGKFQDIVYTVGNRGANRSVIIFPDAKTGPSCSHITNSELLKSCFLQSRYEFNIAPYIAEAGVLSEQNGKSLLGNEYSSNLSGRGYVILKEASIELQAKAAAERGGSVPMNFADTFSDRVYRSLVIFNMWIGNTDAKDENSKVFFAKNFSKLPEEIVESQHDLGASLGKRSFPGDVNTFTIDDEFLKISRGSIKFQVPVTYRPLSWDHVTYADARWMSRNISSIPTKKIIEIAHSNTWPSFVQDALAYRLLKRREALARAFSTEEYLDQKNTPAPTIRVDLSTPEKRQKVAMELGIPVGVIDSELSRTRLSNYSDLVVRDGTIVPCGESLLIGILEDYNYPSGLSRRLKRKEDNMALPSCRLSR